MRIPQAMAAFAVVLSTATPAWTARASDVVTPLDATGRPLWAQASAAEAELLRTIGPGAFQALDEELGEAVPSIIPQTLTDLDAAGVTATYIPQGPITSPGSQPFFQSLGTNGRTCQTCHQPAQGWSLTPALIRLLFATNPAAPLFRPVDGAVCPTADTSTAAATRAAYSLLLNQGLIRIFISMPTTGLQFAITKVVDPYDCTSDPATGLTSPTTGIVSEYRRPLPATNLAYLSDILWDDREPSLESQASDATRIHSQATAVPSTQQVDEMVSLESALYSAQSFDLAAGDLTADGAQGGARVLSSIPFTVGENAPGPGINPSVMTLFLTWNDSADPAQAAVARGENIFNEKTFAITGVAGLNDVSGSASIQGTCSSCHNAPQVGSNSVGQLLDTGLADAPGTVPGDEFLTLGTLPVYTVTCTAGPLASTTKVVTDLGRGLITGQCADVGKMKVPTLRNLAARPPYFHNGSAASLADVVAFYDSRFDIGLTPQQQADLVAFLSAL